MLMFIDRDRFEIVAGMDCAIKHPGHPLEQPVDGLVDGFPDLLQELQHLIPQAVQSHLPGLEGKQPSSPHLCPGRTPLRPLKSVPLSADVFSAVVSNP